MQEALERALNEVEDPELGIGIVDLGLIYRAEWTRTGIEVDFTTTVPSCPYAELLHEQIDSILRKRFREASVVLVRFVLDPPWKLDRLTEKARKTLGWARSMTADKNDTSRGEVCASLLESRRKNEALIETQAVGRMAPWRCFLLRRTWSPFGT
jgi:metal-sulfur cluster biosynthetic enzyme